MAEWAKRLIHPVKPRTVLNAPDGLFSDGQVVPDVLGPWAQEVAEWARARGDEDENRGVVAHRDWPDNDGPYNAVGLTAMFVQNVKLKEGFFYGIVFHSPITYGGGVGNRALLRGVVGPFILGRCADITDTINNQMDSQLFFACPRTDEYAVGVTCEGISGGAFTLAAGASAPRSITIIGYGLSPTRII